jgi:TRAP-type C4-dicarboxylate transport system permease small subunit
VIALDRLRQTLERFLEIWVVFLVSALTAIVVLAVIWRKAGASFVWYDEVASIILAWITYYGAALAALKRAHIGFDGSCWPFPITGA